MTEIEQPTLKLDPIQTFRILTLENRENIDKLAQACKTAGHQVVPVLSIREALEFLETKDHVDVIVSAAHLEHESAFEFLKRVKAEDSHLASVPFLMLCAEPGALALVTSPAVHIAADMLGADKYVLMQNFDAEELMKHICPLLPAIPSKELAV